MRINIRVKAHSSKVFVKKLGEDSYTISVTELPENGKANRGVIRALAKHFKVPQSRIQITAGKSARAKIVEVQN